MDKLLIFILIIGLSYAEKECQKGWFKVKEYCYRVGSEHLNNFDAEKYCKNLTSSLAEFEQEKIPQGLKIKLFEDYIGL